MIWSRYKTAAIVIAPDGLLTYNRAEYGMLRATLPGMYVRARARVAAAPHSAVVSRKFLAGHEITVRGAKPSRGWISMAPVKTSRAKSDACPAVCASSAPSRL